ncbi:hypothetical protein [Alienimonas californiensis]|uniref:GIY-YIG domain-containing protein n=1 Tax=Alienimonas californiensis TaxID=2527989 RepID=A0A517P5P5_9PLAN|nr:hypothetical protein [Alienimonas californiensis]QDT14691.1 hypothetical protein CA12_07690 [Alienimonas californiensis]
MVERLLRTVFKDPTPNGPAWAEFNDGFVKVARAPRGQMDKLTRGEGFGDLYVYVLTGPLSGEMPAPVYIGHSRRGSKRRGEHARDGRRDFWEETFHIYLPRDRFSRDQAEWLERHLIQRAVEAEKHNLVDLKNEQRPRPEELGLRAHDLNILPSVTFDLDLILPTLGLRLLATPCRLSAPASAATALPPAINAKPKRPAGAPFKMVFRGRTARAVATDGGLTVLAGSAASATSTASLTKGYHLRRSQLITNGDLAERAAEDGGFGFARDVFFKGNPTESAAIIRGYSESGPRAWKRTDTGQTYGDWVANGRPT